MIQINCSIIKDLLPLYADDVVCYDTAKLVEKHLEHCPNCRQELERMKEMISVPIDNSTQPMKLFKKKWHKKKTAIAVSASIITAALLIGSFVLYSYLTPVISFAVSKPVDTNTESYAQMITVGYSSKLGLPMPTRIQENLAAFGVANNDALTELHENYTTPMQIDASVSVADGQTTVVYSGTVTDKSGNTVPYEKTLTFDFVLTDETP